MYKFNRISAQTFGSVTVAKPVAKSEHDLVVLVTRVMVTVLGSIFVELVKAIDARQNSFALAITFAVLAEAHKHLAEFALIPFMFVHNGGGAISHVAPVK